MVANDKLCYNIGMSTSVKIPTTPISKTPILQLIDPKKYAFGYRDEQQKFHLADFAQTIIVFDKQRIGRGVELTFEETYIEVRLCAPSTSADYNIFVDLIESLIKILDVKELICEEEHFSIELLNEVYKIAETNMRSALDFVVSAPLSKTGPIAIFGVFQELTIDPVVQKNFRKGGQAAFNKLLYEAQKDNILH